MFSRVLRAITSGMSPSGPRGRLTALIFHRVLAAPDPLRPTEPTGTQFASMLEWIGRQFHVLPLCDAVQGLRDRRLPSRALVVTFDDGYADNEQVAAPILRKLGMPATFFVATGYLNGGRPFIDTLIDAVGGSPLSELDLTSVGLGHYCLDTLNDRRRTTDELVSYVKGVDGPERGRVANEISALAHAEPRGDLMMSDDQVLRLAKDGFEIGGHTMTHPILARLDADAAALEIDQGRRQLESITGRPIRFFAYPNGRPGCDYSRATVEVVRRLGFEAAMTTAPGVADADSDLLQMPRFAPWDRDPWRLGARLIRNLANNRPVLAGPSEGSR